MTLGVRAGVGHRESACWVDHFGALDDRARRSLDDRARRLGWTVADYEQWARAHRPPHGECAVVLAGTGELIGLVGLVRQ